MIICYTGPEIWCVSVIIFHFGLFLPFYSPNSLKNQNEKKNEKKKKKAPGDIIILHKCTKSHDHMLYRY